MPIGDADSIVAGAMIDGANEPEITMRGRCIQRETKEDGEDEMKGDEAAADFVLVRGLLLRGPLNFFDFPPRARATKSR